MLPCGGKMELRLRGPCMTPGYFRRDDLTNEAYDENGFYITGDAGRFVDPDDPAKGILFDGRVAEDFKLLTGTWVSTGSVRVGAISACAEIIQDAVITGHDRDEVGLLIVPNIAGMAKIAGVGADTAIAELTGNDSVLQTLRDSIAAHNLQNPASSTRIMRALFLAEPLSIDAGEITDKGYVNQHAVLERRHGLVEQLYNADAAANVLD